MDQESSPRYPPHLIDLRKKEIIQPILVDNKRIISLSSDQQVTVACVGPNNIITAINRSISTARCISSSLRIDAQSLPYKSIGCKSQVKESIKESKQCSTNGTLIEIGWQIGSSFINQLTICHERTTANTLYAYSFIRGASILADDESNTRPAFRKGSYFNGINVEKAYTQNSQNAVLTQTLGSASLARLYLDTSKSFYFARGHLAPDGDFIDAASQDATYYYINCVPQWQSFNNGNWKELEMAVRNLAARRKADYTIYTGTYGILTLPDVKGQQKPINLADYRIPVPKYFWKVIHDPTAKKATAVIGINNPHLAKIKDEDVFCPDICNQISWIKFERKIIARGFTFCCNVPSLHKVISYSPDLGNISLLD